MIALTSASYRVLLVLFIYQLSCLTKVESKAVSIFKRGLPNEAEFGERYPDLELQKCMVCSYDTCTKTSKTPLCHPCRCFFWRWTKKGITHEKTCTSNQQCDLSTPTGRKCIECRYKRCLSVQMNINPNSIENQEQNPTTTIQNPMESWNFTASSSREESDANSHSSHFQQASSFHEKVPVSPFSSAVTGYSFYKPYWLDPTTSYDGGMSSSMEQMNVKDHTSYPDDKQFHSDRHSQDHDDTLKEMERIGKTFMKFANDPIEKNLKTKSPPLKNSSFASSNSQSSHTFDAKQGDSSSFSKFTDSGSRDIGREQRRANLDKFLYPDSINGASFSSVSSNSHGSNTKKVPEEKFRRASIEELKNMKSKKIKRN